MKRIAKSDEKLPPFNGEPDDLAELALWLACYAYEKTGDDPRRAFVATITAGAAAGHMINKTPDEIRKMLDDVMDAAHAAVLHATEELQ